MCEGDVNEFPRESLPKLFSYAVAALSTLDKIARVFVIHSTIQEGAAFFPRLLSGLSTLGALLSHR